MVLVSSNQVNGLSLPLTSVGDNELVAETGGQLGGARVDPISWEWLKKSLVSTEKVKKESFNKASYSSLG